MKNKILIGLTCLFVLICTVGCVNTKENTNVKNDNVKSDTEQTVKSKCSYYECLTKMSLDNTLEELNGIVGFEATKLESTSLSSSDISFFLSKHSNNLNKFAHFTFKIATYFLKYSNI